EAKSLPQANHTRTPTKARWFVQNRKGRAARRPARPYANLNLEHGSPAYQATHAYIKTATSTSSI
ncbi:MAG: hypothetical protein ACK6CG_09415, partial [Pseudanabaena sp.]